MNESVSAFGVATGQRTSIVDLLTDAALPLRALNTATLFNPRKMRRPRASLLRPCCVAERGFTLTGDLSTQEANELYLTPLCRADRGSDLYRIATATIDAAHEA